MRARRRDREHVSGDDRAPQPDRTRERTASSGSGGPGGHDPRSRAGQGGGGGKGRGRSRNRNRNRAGAPRNHEAGFWGDAATLPEPRQDVRITDDAAAVARSLGAPPLPGHEAIAEHYFRVVYERAVMTAGALAAAGGLIDPDILAEELAD